jgi:hypothetical protein
MPRTSKAFFFFKIYLAVDAIFEALSPRHAVVQEAMQAVVPRLMASNPQMVRPTTTRLVFEVDTPRSAREVLFRHFLECFSQKSSEERLHMTELCVFIWQHWEASRPAFGSVLDKSVWLSYHSLKVPARPVPTIMHMKELASVLHGHSTIAVKPEHVAITCTMEQGQLRDPDDVTPGDNMTPA